MVRDQSATSAWPFWSQAGCRCCCENHDAIKAATRRFHTIFIACDPLLVSDKMPTGRWSSFACLFFFWLWLQGGHQHFCSQSDRMMVTSGFKLYCDWGWFVLKSQTAPHKGAFRLVQLGGESFRGPDRLGDLPGLSGKLIIDDKDCWMCTKCIFTIKPYHIYIRVLIYSLSGRCCILSASPLSCDQDTLFRLD